MKKIILPLITLLSVSLTTVALAASPWPASTSSTNIASGLSSYNSGFEASGISYHSGYGYLIVGDDGDLGIVDSSGVVQDYVNLGGDLEGITVADHASNYAYIADEARNSIREVDLSSTSYTGNEWTLDLTQSGGLGFEAIAYVPQAHAPSSWGTSTSGGFFVAGTQADTDLSVYNPNLSSSASLTSLATIATPYTDVAGLHYSTETERLYVLHDSANKMKEYSLDGTQQASYELPTSAAEEGIYLAPDCPNGIGDIAITDDGGATADVYNQYPISCDQDHDGVDATMDCNDLDATVSTPQAYYEDTDGDGLGKPGTRTELCVGTPPAGYTDNDLDTNDTIPNAGVEINGDGTDNDGDGIIDEVNTLTENGAHPYYSTLDPLDDHSGNILYVRAFSPLNKSIDVRFADNSVYRYEIFSRISFWRLTITRAGDTAIAMVQNRWSTHLINFLTGGIL